MFCTKCGSQLPAPPPSFCAACGAAIHAEEVLASVAFAGFWRRAAAYVIDYVVGLALFGLSQFLAMLTWEGLLEGTGIVPRWFVGMFGSGGRADDNMFTFFGSLGGLLLFWLYYAYMESSKLQGTLGKLVLRIAVTDQHCARVSFGRATGRFFAKMVSAVTLGIGFILAGVTEKKQALHDILAGCLVVQKHSLRK